MTKLQKIEPHTPDPKSIWNDDVLNREKVAKFFIRLIMTASQSFVIGLHAPFGAGKTFFLQRLKLHLDKDGFSSIYYNAWETDFHDDPFLAFMSIITKEIDNSLPRAKEILTKLERTGTSFLKKISPTLIRIVARRLLGDKNVDEIISLVTEDPDTTKNSLSDFAASLIMLQTTQSQTLYQFREYLGEAQQSITGNKDSNHKNLIILIDELDRCRPDYAVKFLECIKHFFSVPGIIFIIAVDDKQLSNYIKTVFGSEIDSNLYLRKFIDWRFKLPIGRVKDYVRHSTNWFFPEDSGNRNAMLIFGEWAEVFQLTLREVEQCLTELNLILRIADDDYPPWSFGYIIALRCSREDLYYGHYKYRNIAVKDLVKDVLKSINIANTPNKGRLRNYAITTHISRQSTGNLRLDTEIAAALDEALNYAKSVGNHAVTEWTSMDTSIGEQLFKTIDEASAYLL